MSLPHALDHEPTMVHLIESGRHFYANKEYKHALVLFTETMRCCPCAKGVERDRCRCKDFKRVAVRGGSIFREAMHTCHCYVGRMFSKCDNRCHIQALESRSATFEALGQLGQAMKDAEWILELAPRLPDGYLCVGKIAELKKHDGYAWKMYTAGIEAVKESSVNSSPKLQQLYDARKPLNRRFFRQDPLSLPAELVTHIFSYLEWTELLPCLRVCKQWMRTLTSPLHGPLWRNMILPDIDHYDTIPEGSSCLDLLTKISSWAGDGGFRKIVIPLEFDLVGEELTLLLKTSPSLEILEVFSLMGFSFPSEENIWNKLRHVTIDDYHDSLDTTTMDLPGHFPYRFLQNAASSLEHLTFTGVPQQWYRSEPLIPQLPKLKFLRIGGWNDDTTPFPMFPLAIAFPRLEQLWIGPDLPNIDPGPVALWRARWEGVWRHLKVLIVDASEAVDMEAVPYLGLKYLMCLNRGNSLLHLLVIGLFTVLGDGDRDIFGIGDDDTSPSSDVIRYADFRNLRSVRSDGSPWIWPDRARRLLSNSIENRQLTSFDIIFPKSNLGINSPPAGDSRIRYLKGYDWLRGAPSIHTLGCYGLDFRSLPGNDNDLPLPQFLATFPNLRTLNIDTYRYPDNGHEFANFILAIMSVTRLRTIHTRSFGYNSEAQRKVKKAAQLQGVQILTAEYDVPEQWPIPLVS